MRASGPNPTLIVTVVVLLLVGLTGCSSVGDYLLHRGTDFLDIVDVKIGSSLGIGAKVEATDYVGTGLGFGLCLGAVEFCGRRVLDTMEVGGAFLHLGIVGLDGGIHAIGKTGWFTPERNYFLFQTKERRLPLVTRFRFGGEIWFLASLGIYVNVGEVADFLLGFGNLDIANDDGVMKGANWRDAIEDEIEQELSETTYEEALSQLQDDDDYQQERAARLIRSFSTGGRGADRRAVDIILSQIDHENPKVRANLMWALGNYDDDRVEGVLLRKLNDADETVREAAKGALSNLRMNRR